MYGNNKHGLLRLIRIARAPRLPLLALSLCFQACLLDDASPPGLCFDDKDCQTHQACVLSQLDDPLVPGDNGSLDAGKDAHSEEDAAAGPFPDGGYDAGSSQPRRRYGRCECRSDRCGPQQACTTESARGSCIPVGCSSPADCSAGQTCLSGSCYDLAASCTAEAMCRVPTAIRKRFDVSCSGTCRSAVKSMADIVWPLKKPTTRDARLLRPQLYETVQDSSALVFEWTPPPDDGWSMLIVTTRIVLTESDIARAAKWYAYIPNKLAGPTDHAATWSDGVGPDGEAGTPPDALPPGMYYATVLHMREGAPTSASAQVPFRVGPWPDVGAPCDDALDRFAGCERPDRPQACFESECRVLCLSHDDCADHLGVSNLCGLPDAQNFRFCPTPDVR